MLRIKRETGFEPATACLEGRGSSTELLPRARWDESPLDVSRSGREDLNLRPRGPKPRALGLTELRPDRFIQHGRVYSTCPKTSSRFRYD